MAADYYLQLDGIKGESNDSKQSEISVSKLIDRPLQCLVAGGGDLATNRIS